MPSAAPCSPARAPVVPRMTDIYAALPAITGKFELEYEGELRGADNVARDIIRAAVGNVFSGYFAGADLRQVTEWFDLGGTLQIDDTLDARACSRAPRRSRDCATSRHRSASRARRPPRCRGGSRFRARGALRPEEDRALRGMAVSGRRAAAPPRAAAAEALDREISLPTRRRSTTTEKWKMGNGKWERQKVEGRRQKVKGRR